MNYLVYLPFALLLLVLRTCAGSETPLHPEGFVTWCDDPDNGLVVSKKVNKFNFELQYKPLEYVVLRDNAGVSLSEQVMREQKNEMSLMQYFTFRISSDDGGDLLRDDASTVDHFSSRLKYFAGEMQKDLSLIEGKDTLPCQLFHFERTYGIDPRSTFVLGFPLGKNDGEGGRSSNEDKILLFKDHDLGTGPVYITVSSGNINRIPSLNLK